MGRCRVFSITGEELSPCRWARAKKLVKESKAEKFKLDGLQCIKMLEPILKEKEMENEFKFPETLYQYVNDINGYILEYRKTKEMMEGAPLYFYKIYNDDEDEEQAKCIVNKEIDIFRYGCEKSIDDINAEENYELEVAPVRISLQQAKNDEKFFKKQKLIELKQRTEKLEKDLSEFPEKLFKFRVPKHDEDTFITEFHFHKIYKLGEAAIYLEKPCHDNDLDEKDWDQETIFICEIDHMDSEAGIIAPTFRSRKEDVIKDFEEYIEIMKGVVNNYKKDNEVQSKENFPEKLYKFCISNSKLLSDHTIYEFDLYKIESEKCAQYIIDFKDKKFAEKHTVFDCQINCDFLGAFYPFRTSFEDAVKDFKDYINTLKNKLSLLP